MHFGENFITQKLLGTPNLAGVGHLIEPQIQIWKDHGASLSRGVYKMKVVVSVLNRYFLPIVHDHRDRALAWRGLQVPGRPMSGYHNIL